MGGSVHFDEASRSGVHRTGEPPREQADAARSSSPSPALLDSRVRPPRRRWIIISTWAVLLLIVGAGTSVLAVMGYLRSDGYRHAMERRLGDRLGLRLEMDRVDITSIRGRRLLGARAYLPESGTQVFEAARTDWALVPDEAGRRYALTLADGWLLAGEGRWRRPDYERMLARGFGHDFSSLRIGRILVRDVDLRFAGDGLRIDVGRCAGGIDLRDDGGGEGELTSSMLNGWTVSPPLTVRVRFDPSLGGNPRFRSAAMQTPPIPLSALLGGSERRDDGGGSGGTFTGSIGYDSTESAARLTAGGRVDRGDLTLLNDLFPSRRWAGLIDVELKRMTLVDRRLVDLDLDGYVEGLEVSGLLRPGAARRLGRVDLRMDELRVRAERIESFRGGASVSDVSLADVADLFDAGGVAGTCTIEISNLVIRDDVIVEADATLNVTAPDDLPGFVDRELVGRLAKSWVGVNPAALLPERLEYSRLGVRLRVRDGELRLLGSHGADGKTILTARVWGRDVELLREPAFGLPVPDVVGMLRERAGDVEVRDVQKWWRAFERADVPRDRQNERGNTGRDHASESEGGDE